MNSKWPLVWVLVVAVAVAVEGSLLLRHSLLRPRNSNECFSCRASDRPMAYPLISFFGKVKDVFVKMFKEVIASAKEHKLDSK
ncbi:hypothetical protein evm_001371 [Chilo suppressalis]|nr:hypothetical protein evm_001371 [Chilo suppressalis]